jgi:hypothetical protein
MVGITLSQEQIRAAPPDVRHWLEQQVAALFGAPGAEEPQPVTHALASCTVQEAHGILEQIQNLLPVVSVFFELGRESAGVVAGQGVRSLNVAEIQRHARLRSPEQVAQCADVINQVLGSLRRDPQAMICAFDQQGRCFVTEATAHSILNLWHDIVVSRGLQPLAGTAPQSLPIAEPV